MIFFDQTKAFDRCEWPWIQRCLEKMQQSNIPARTDLCKEMFKHVNTYTLKVIGT